MNRAEILAATSMPLLSPSYTRGPYRFTDREYLLIHYESDPEAIRAILPEPLEPDGNHVVYEWMRMPKSSGFGDYSESGVAIRALFRGQKVTFTVMMLLDDEAPTTGGREIWGFPKKTGQPSLKVTHETLTGVLDYDGERVATGTMVYDAEMLDPEVVRVAMSGLNVNLKFLPDVDGTPKIVQLVGYRLEDLVVKRAYSGKARLHLVPHAGCCIADLPVRRVLFGQHIVTDLTLPYGEVLHDYLEDPPEPDDAQTNVVSLEPPFPGAHAAAAADPVPVALRASST